MALIILAAILGLMTIFSAYGKLSMMENVVEMLNHVGLNERQIRLLGTIEILGALGLLVGIWVPIAHIRVRDSIKDMGPAILLTVISVVVAVLEFSR